MLKTLALVAALLGAGAAGAQPVPEQMTKDPDKAGAMREGDKVIMMLTWKGPKTS
jgi:hypothetical protein